MSRHALVCWFAFLAASGVARADTWLLPETTSSCADCVDRCEAQCESGCANGWVACTNSCTGSACDKCLAKYDTCVDMCYVRPNVCELSCCGM